MGRSVEWPVGTHPGHIAGPSHDDQSKETNGPVRLSANVPVRAAQSIRGFALSGQQRIIPDCVTNCVTISPTVAEPTRTPWDDYRAQNVSESLAGSG